MKLKAKYAPRRDGTYGKVLDYQINEQGIVDVTDDAHARALLATDNFERADGKEVAPVEMLIQNGEQTIDLMKLNKDELLTLANVEMGLEMHPRCGEPKLREAIMEFCNSGG